MTWHADEFFPKSTWLMVVAWPDGPPSLRRVLRQIEARARKGQSLTGVPDLHEIIMALMHLVFSFHYRSGGLLPTLADLYAETRNDARLKRLSPTGLRALIAHHPELARRVNVDWAAGETAKNWRVDAALLFFPVGEGERYRVEWEAEMAAMSPAEAAQFSRCVLRRAPRSGFILWVCKFLGRLA
ncbi:hypothetical protein [Streptomyces californicus]|uniref:hypothetical protein n=1 Tax=Streptomyces californicus TaxID=67351 RepID=UPI003829E142